MNAGARDENPAENGLSHFIEHMIFKGTQKRSAYMIAKEFDAIGGQSNAFTTMENTCYYAKVMDCHLDTMTDILLDIFLNSLFDPEEVERERTVILQEIGMMEDTPDDYVHTLAASTFWGDPSPGKVRAGDSGKPVAVRRGTPERVLPPPSTSPTASSYRRRATSNHGRLVELIGPALSAIKPGNGFPERLPPAGRTLA